MEGRQRGLRVTPSNVVIHSLPGVGGCLCAPCLVLVSTPVTPSAAAMAEPRSDWHGLEMALILPPAPISWVSVDPCVFTFSDSRTEFPVSLHMRCILTCLLHLACAEPSTWGTLRLSCSVLVLALTQCVDDSCSRKPSLTIQSWADGFFIIPETWYRPHKNTHHLGL